MVSRKRAVGVVFCDFILLGNIDGVVYVFVFALLGFVGDEVVE